MILYIHPIVCLTTELVDIPQVIEELFDTLFQIDAVLASLGENDCFDIIGSRHYDISDFLPSQTRMEEREYSVALACLGVLPCVQDERIDESFHLFSDEHDRVHRRSYDLLGYVGMEFLGILSELSHIAEEEYLVVLSIEPVEVSDTSGDGIVSAIVAPIYYKGFTYSFEYRTTSFLRMYIGETLLDALYIHPETHSERKYWEDIIYLEFSDKRIVHII